MDSKCFSFSSVACMKSPYRFVEKNLNEVNISDFWSVVVIISQWSDINKHSAQKVVFNKMLL